MKYGYLGSTGVKVSKLCLGTMTFGRETDEKESHRILSRFTEAGGNFIDTANVYSRGGSESIIGTWLSHQKRDDLVIASKVRFPMDEGINDTGASRKVIRRHVEESLDRLGTDYIDLYQLHCWDRGTPLEETLDAMDSLVAEGLVRYIGASNYTGWQLQKAIMLQRQNGWEPFRTLQPQYSLLCRTTEWELVPVCQAEGLGVLPWSPLKGGWLSGKYQRGMDTPPEGSRAAREEARGGFSSWSRMNRESTWRVLDAVGEVAAESGKTIAQISLAWLLSRPVVTSPIIGVRTMEHLEQALGSLDVELSPSQIEKLDAASETEQVYPWDFVNWAQEGR